MGAIKSRLGPLKGHDLASPEPSLGQGQPTPEDLRLARGPPQATNTPSARPRAPSGDGHTFGSPEAQSSPRSNLGQIATPTDRIAGAFNARMT
jgi:hypothetical protein